MLGEKGVDPGQRAQPHGIGVAQYLVGGIFDHVELRAGKLRRDTPDFGRADQPVMLRADEQDWQIDAGQPLRGEGGGRAEGARIQLQSGSPRSNVGCCAHHQSSSS